MASVFVVLRHDYEADCASSGEFESPTEVVGVFRSRKEADNCVEMEYGEDDPSEVGYGLEVEEHELQEDGGESPKTGPKLTVLSDLFEELETLKGCTPRQL